MLDFLRELQEVDQQHGDFHSGNVLVEDRSASLTGPPYVFRITDFGVPPLTSGTTLLDDFDQVGVMLRDLLAAVDYQACTVEDRYMYRVLNDDFLAKGLLERDVAHDERARNPALLFESLRNAELDLSVKRAASRTGHWLHHSITSVANRSVNPIRFSGNYIRTRCSACQLSRIRTTLC